MTQSLTELTQRVLYALPKAEIGHQYAQRVVRRAMRDWAEFVDFDEDRLRELGHALGGEILFQAWDGRFETVHEAHEQGLFSIGIITYREGRHLDAFITLVIRRAQ